MLWFLWEENVRVGYLRDGEKYIVELMNFVFGFA